MIGLRHASWQPERVMQAKYGGDFWIWEYFFRTCVGGTHPWLKRFYCKSEGLYTMLNVINKHTNQGIEESHYIPTCSTVLQNEVKGIVDVSMLTTKEAM